MINNRVLTIFLILMVALLAACAPQAMQPTEAVLPESGAAATAPVESSLPESIETEPPASPTEQEPVKETAAPEAQGEESAGAEVVTYFLVPGESSLTYEVGETFFGQNNRFNVAVGTTTTVNGEIRVDVNQPQNSSLGTFTADISEFQSDSARRDNALRGRFLESSRYPTVTFVPAEISGLPQAYNSGETIQFQVSGDLTIRDVTRPVTFDVTAQLQDGTLSGTAATTILMSDFEFGPISIAGMLGTEDEVRVTLNFVARP
jgi:polyisoprenoid-binding protein YceI